MVWIPLDRNKSATPAAKGLTDDLNIVLIDTGEKVINLGQGRETKEPGGDLGKCLTGQFRFSSGYNGKAPANVPAAFWLERHIGIPATPETTHVLQTNGRDVLDKSICLAAGIIPAFGDERKVILQSSLSWPLVSEQVADHLMISQEYDILAEDLAKETRIRLSQIVEGDENVVAAVYRNTPHNASGRHITAEENRRIMTAYNEANSWYGYAGNNRSFICIDDNPYFHASAQRPKGEEGSRLMAGYDGVLKADSSTPWIHVISMSKAWGSASPGVTIVVTHPKLAPAFGKRLARTTAGSYVPELMNGVAEVMDEKHDEEMLSYFGELRQKYIDNRNYLCSRFGDAVIPGGASMTSLVKLDKNLFGHTVTCHDGKERTMNDVDDIVEYMANEHHVVVVNNGGDLSQGTGLMRVAQAVTPEQFQEGVARLEEGFQKIENSSLALTN